MNLFTVIALSWGCARVEGIIDRFEGDFAIIEWAGGPLVDVPRHWVPADCQEGDAIALLGWPLATPPPFFPGATAPLSNHTISVRLAPCRGHHTQEPR